MSSRIDDIINKIREVNPGNRPFIIYVNVNTYNQIQEEMDTREFDYNSMTIIMLQNNSTLAIDKDLADEEIIII
jgi:hypothetical protein